MCGRPKKINLVITAYVVGVYCRVIQVALAYSYRHAGV